MMYGRKIKYIAILSALTISLLLTACSSTAVMETKPVPRKTGTVLNFWTIDLKDSFSSYFNNLFDAYEETHSDVVIDWTDVSYDEMADKLNEAVENGNAPDVVNLNTQMALSFAGKDMLTDVGSMISDEQKSVYTESLWKSAEANGKVYAIPWYSSPDIMFFNKELFLKAGLASLLGTMDEALIMAPRFKKTTGAYLFSPGELYYFLMENNIPIVTEDGTKAAFNTEKTVELLTRYKKASDDGIIPKTIWESWEDELSMYNSGELATITSSGSFLNVMKKDSPDVYNRTGISKPLVGSSGLSRNSLMNLVILLASKHKDQALDFALYTTNDENQLALCMQTAVFPSTVKAGENPYFMSDMSSLEGRTSAMSAKASQTSKDFSLGVVYQDEIQYAVNEIYDYKFTRLLPPPKGSGFPPITTERILFMNHTSRLD